MKPRRGPSGPAKVEQNMTPMIDIVFQLLTFFIMTLKIATQEGDFNIKMPLAALGTTYDHAATRRRRFVSVSVELLTIPSRDTVPHGDSAKNRKSRRRRVDPKAGRGAVSAPRQGTAMS